MQLWREIQTLGYTHSARTVGRFITRLRRAAVACPLVCPAVKRLPAAQIDVERLGQAEPGIARAQVLIQRFPALVRERRGDELETWMTEAMESGIAELARFARGLQETWPQSKPGSPWSGATG